MNRTETVSKYDRLLGHIQGASPGPTFVFIGGIHGNEPSGIKAIQHVFNTLKSQTQNIKGSIYGIAGNLWALEHKQRYCKQDLNRLWSAENLKTYSEHIPQDEEDIKQMMEINETLKSIIDVNKGPFYFIDLHTTSGNTPPFLTVNDMLLNRKFTKQYNLPVILGIEEYLEGPLLSYINELGYVAFGFEGGQNEDPISIKNHIAFIYLSLGFAGMLSNLDNHIQEAQKHLNPYLDPHFYEIINGLQLSDNDNFIMNPGYRNFTPLLKGQVVGRLNRNNAKSPIKGLIFMPLYQKEGSDAFFIIRKIPTFFLWLSKYLRKLKVDRLLVILPGVNWLSKRKNKLVINKSIARFFADEFLHLLGYRNKKINDELTIATNREFEAKKSMYKKAPWY